MTVSDTAYLVLVPVPNYAGKITSIKIDRLTKKKPSLSSGEIAVRIKLNFESEQLEETITTVEATIKGFRTPITELFVD